MLDNILFNSSRVCVFCNANSRSAYICTLSSFFCFIFLSVAKAICLSVSSANLAVSNGFKTNQLGAFSPRSASIKYRLMKSLVGPLLVRKAIFGISGSPKPVRVAYLLIALIHTLYVVGSPSNTGTT